MSAEETATATDQIEAMRKEDMPPAMGMGTVIGPAIIYHHEQYTFNIIDGNHYIITDTYEWVREKSPEAHPVERS